jgi:hypothetical protein
MVVPRENRLNTVYSSGLQVLMAGWSFMPVFPVRKPVRAQPEGAVPRDDCPLPDALFRKESGAAMATDAVDGALHRFGGVLAAGKTVPVVTREA